LGLADESAVKTSPATFLPDPDQSLTRPAS
jgi:hypothetical protein